MAIMKNLVDIYLNLLQMAMLYINRLDVVLNATSLAILRVIHLFAARPKRVELYRVGISAGHRPRPTNTMHLVAVKCIPTQ